MSVYSLENLIHANEIFVIMNGETVLHLEGKNAAQAFCKLYGFHQVKGLTAFGGAMEITIEEDADFPLPTGR